VLDPEAAPDAACSTPGAVLSTVFCQCCRYYEEQGKEIDFFFAVEPAWLERFPEEAKRVRSPVVALVSPEKEWMT
jgi:hypothetical protein